MAESNKEYKIGATNKMNFEESKSLEFTQPTNFFPLIVDAQHRDSWQIETSNHVCVLIQLCIAIAIECLCCDFSTSMASAVRRMQRILHRAKTYGKFWF